MSSNSTNVPCVIPQVVSNDTPAAPATPTASRIVQHGEIRGKLRFLVNSKAIINFNSGFDKKLLCDGITFTAGQACVFNCTFCYVADILKSHTGLRDLRQERGLAWNEMVVDISDAANKARSQLVDRKGKPKFTDPTDTRVVFASPLVDVAATMEHVGVTVDICKVILEHTHWQIRLLSKSSLLRQVAERIPKGHKQRVIYGLSTGTIDSNLAASFEKGTALVSKRLETISWLQDNGYRTYAMVCPILPQADYKAFAEQMTAAIDVPRCEHVWAEPINVRGQSLIATAQVCSNNSSIRPDASSLLRARTPFPNLSKASCSTLAFSRWCSSVILRMRSRCLSEHAHLSGAGG
jgi:DNA repair photolyase